MHINPGFVDDDTGTQFIDAALQRPDDAHLRRPALQDRSSQAQQSHRPGFLPDVPTTLSIPTRSLPHYRYI